MLWHASCLTVAPKKGQFHILRHFLGQRTISLAARVENKLNPRSRDYSLRLARQKVMMFLFVPGIPRGTVATTFKNEKDVRGLKTYRPQLEGVGESGLPEEKAAEQLKK